MPSLRLALHSAVVSLARPLASIKGSLLLGLSTLLLAVLPAAGAKSRARPEL